MSTSKLNNHRGERSELNQCYRFTVKYLRDGKWETDPHANYASSIGEALYAAHAWIQHEWGVAVGDYEIVECVRVLRIKGFDGTLQDSGKTMPIEIDACVRKNPVIPPPEPKKPIKKDDSYADGFEFMADVPKLSKWDIERQREKEQIA